MRELATAEFLLSIKDNKGAKKVLDVLKPYVRTLEQIDALGKLYSEANASAECLEMALMALSCPTLTKDQEITLKINAIRSYIKINKPVEALALIDDIDPFLPDNQENKMDKAMCLFLLNRKDEAEQLLREIAKNPKNQDLSNRTNFNLGTYNLARGNFKEGLRGFLLEGRKLDIWAKHPLPSFRRWEGGIEPGKTIMLSTEGGVGDEIISVRFMKHFRDRGMNPIWYTDRKDVARVFERNGFPCITDLKDYDLEWLWCYAMPTPCYLDLSEKDLWYGPYLTPIRQTPKLDGKLKIGIKSGGNPDYDQDLHRSVPLNDIVDCLPEHATIYSFHYDEDVDHPRVTPLRGKINSWDDTLDYIDQMDIIVSTCTSLPHAASAMGKKTIVLVPILNYYTWAYPTLHSDWYSTNTRLLRQKEYDNWRAPLLELKEIMNNEYSKD